MLKTAVIAFCVILGTFSIKSQDINLKLKESSYSQNNFSKLKPASLTKKTGDPLFVFAIYGLVLINPMLVIEDKKAFFGLTKEISFGISSAVRAGRISFEYSYIFRNYNRNHLRFSYNYDIVLNDMELALFIATPGAGYFTDTKNKGWFLQGSAGIFFAPMENIALYPYLRYRHTFITNENKSDIDDISLGMAFLIYL
jgi:hypothetical protein